MEIEEKLCLHFNKAIFSFVYSCGQAKTTNLGTQFLGYQFWLKPKFYHRNNVFRIYWTEWHEPITQKLNIKSHDVPKFWQTP